MASGRNGSNQVGSTKDLLACGSIIMAIDQDVCSRLLSLNQQSYTYGTWCIASAGGGGYLLSAAL